MCKGALGAHENLKVRVAITGFAIAEDRVIVEAILDRIAALISVDLAHLVAWQIDKCGEVDALHGSERQHQHRGVEQAIVLIGDRDLQNAIADSDRCYDCHGSGNSIRA